MDQRKAPTPSGVGVYSFRNSVGDCFRIVACSLAAAETALEQLARYPAHWTLRTYRELLPAAAGTEGLGLVDGIGLVSFKGTGATLRQLREVAP